MHCANKKSRMRRTEVKFIMETRMNRRWKKKEGERRAERVRNDIRRKNKSGALHSVEGILSGYQE